ncbi:MAG TPA: multidrug transporter [Stellaceae bacterium]|nr:multidrug transporter [Stellaceae bacterium]
MIGGRLAAGAAIIAVALAGLAAWGFVESRSEAAREAAPAQPPQRVSTVQGEPVITLDAKAQHDDGIVTLTLHNAPHQIRLTAYGSVVDLAPLTDLANAYANATARLAIARAKFAAAQSAFERARKLYKEGQNIAAAQLEAAEAAFRVDQAGLMAAQSQLRMQAATAQQAWGSVLGGAVVNGTDLLRRLIARQEVLVQVTLQPGQAIREPLPDAFIEADSGRRVPLHFVSAATRTDPRLQGPSFFFTAPGDGGLLPGMNVVALLPAGPTVDGAVIPAAAIVWQDGRAWAYFRRGPDRFARRAVATDRRMPDGGYIVQGVARGAAVVVAGAQMLLSEEFRAQTGAGGQGDED